MRMRPWQFILLIVMASIPLVFAIDLWFSPWKAGEFRDSPDGQYVATAYNVTRHTLLSGDRHSIELSVVEKESGRDIWRMEWNHPSGANVPDYAMRANIKFVVWAGDSSSVTIPIINNQQLVLPVQ
jgi:hypothetical protein